MEGPEAWLRLAEVIRNRRIEKKLSQAELAANAGTSERTIRLLEKAERTSYQTSTLRAVSSALGWTPLGIEVIIEGGEPIDEVPDEPLSLDDPRVQNLLGDIVKRLEYLEARESERNA